jgi:hypothetical protein
VGVVSEALPRDKSTRCEKGRGTGRLNPSRPLRVRTGAGSLKDLSLGPTPLPNVPFLVGDCAGGASAIDAGLSGATPFPSSVVWAICCITLGETLLFDGPGSVGLSSPA